MTQVGHFFFEGAKTWEQTERKSRTYQRWTEPWVSEWLRIEFLCLILHPSIVSRKKERKKVWNHFRSLIMFHLLYFSILYFSFSFKSLSVFVNPFLFLTSLFLLPMKKMKREMHHLNILCVWHRIMFILNPGSRSKLPSGFFPHNSLLEPEVQQTTLRKRERGKPSKLNLGSEWWFTHFLLIFCVFCTHTWTFQVDWNPQVGLCNNNIIFDPFS